MDEIQRFPSIEDFDLTSQRVQALEPDRPSIRIIAGFEGLPRNYLLVASMPRVMISQVRRTRIVLILDEQRDGRFEGYRFEKWEPDKHGTFEDIPHNLTPAEGEEFLRTLCRPEDRESVARALANARKKETSKYVSNIGILEHTTRPSH